jgi:polyhydroxybutyrate depolymerase
MQVLRVISFTLTGAIALVVVAATLLLRFELPPEPSLSAEPAREALPWRGLSRPYLVYVPAGLGPGAPLVLVFHGSDGDARQARAGFGWEWDRLADEHGFVVAYPEGYEGHWNDCRAVAPYAANRLGVDDVGMTRALVARLVDRHGVDPARVFATGISNGGQMALRLALEAPELVRAVAPVIASLPADENLDCTPSGRPVSVLVMNGTEDPMNPYEGGIVALHGVLGNRGEVVSTEETVAYFAGLAGHEGPGVHEALPDRAPGDDTTIERTRWSAPGRAEVVLYAVRGGGHTVPHPKARFPRLLGRTSGDVVAAEEIWSFFATAP